MVCAQGASWVRTVSATWRARRARCLPRVRCVRANMRAGKLRAPLTPMRHPVLAEPLQGARTPVLLVCIVCIVCFVCVCVFVHMRAHARALVPHTHGMHVWYACRTTHTCTSTTHTCILECSWFATLTCARALSRRALSRARTCVCVCVCVQVTAQCPRGGALNPKH